MRTNRLCIGIGFCLAVIAGTAGGAPAAEKGHEPHVHGESRMGLAIEGNILEVELESPAHDIVGFERMPKTAEQRAAVKRALAVLKDGSALFRFSPGAGCALQGAEVETPLAGAAHGKKAHGHAEEEEHSEFHAHYRFRCAEPGRLKGVEVLLFGSFPAMREIELVAILPGGQRAAALTPRSNRVDF